MITSLSNLLGCGCFLLGSNLIDDDHLWLESEIFHGVPEMRMQTSGLWFWTASIRTSCCGLVVIGYLRWEVKKSRSLENWTDFKTSRTWFVPTGILLADPVRLYSAFGSRVDRRFPLRHPWSEHSCEEWNKSLPSTIHRNEKEPKSMVGA